MKKLSIISLSILGISLAACGSKESDFKTAINAQLTQHPECLSLPLLNPLDIYRADKDEKIKKILDKTSKDFVTIQIYNKDGKQAAWSVDENKQRISSRFDSLVSVGLLSKSTERVDVPREGYTIFTIYTLTDAGKATASPTQFSNMDYGMQKALFGNDRYSLFCYARPELEKVESYTEQNGTMDDGHYARVKYSYKYVVAEWANKPEFRAVFPEIAKHLDNSDKTDEISLVKTDKGWFSDGMHQ